MISNSKSQGIKPKPKQSNPSSDFAAEIREQIKELVMEFPNYSKVEFKCVLELCEYNLKLAQHFLRVTSKSKVKKAITDFLNGHIESGIEGLGLKLDKKLLKELLTEETKTSEEKGEEKVEEFIPTGPNLFETMITKDLIHSILDFLDPKSLGSAGFTCKKFFQISLHPLLFKKFCFKLHHQTPPLPENTPFNTLLQRLNSAPRGEYPSRLVAKANEDVRSLVWLPTLKSFYTPNTYYKPFNKDFREIFLKACRLQFGGVYMMKERYVRVGTKDLTGFYDPYHTVEFYRYLRFFPDGLVMSSLSVNKLKKEKLLKIFSRDSQVQEEEIENLHTSVKTVLNGEFILQESCVHIRLNAKSTFYQFELELSYSAPGVFDQLQMVSQGMRLIESEHCEPLQNNYQGSKLFKFTRIQQMLDDLDPSFANVTS